MLPTLDLPGCALVVLQGTPGDGLMNTIDAQLPDWKENKSENEWRREWESNCVQIQNENRKDWFEQQNLKPPEKDLWWTNKSGALIVYPNPELCLTQSSIEHLPSLQPGTQVVASSIHILQNHGVKSWVSKDLADVRLLKIEVPYVGYVVYSVDGYNYLQAGTVEDLHYHDQWYWRVTCPAGAVVRKGIGLNSQKVTSFPYGSLVHVTAKSVNDAGLSRLQVEYIDPESKTETPLKGWCSESLNPLSGQRGSVLVPLPLITPCKYRVILEDGAVVRSNLELGSRIESKLTNQSLVTVTRRAFSEHPPKSCIPRMQLSTGGWISSRLNRDPPLNLWVVELEQVMKVSNMGTFYVEELKKRRPTTSCQEACLPLPSGRKDSLNSEGKEAASQNGGLEQLTPTLSSASRQAAEFSALKCLICLSEPRTATLVHGGTGHIACCLACARLLMARRDPCPVCRLSIEQVIQHFVA